MLGAGSGWKEVLLAQALGMTTLRRIQAIDADDSLLRQTESELRAAGFTGDFNGRVGDLMEVALERGESGESGCGLVALGILPNVDPEAFLISLKRRLPIHTPVWLSANLTTPGVDEILDQYRNAETERWLEQFFLDQGVKKEQLTWQWSVQPASFGSRVEGYVEFLEESDLTVDGQSWPMAAGERVLAFYSNRMNPQRWDKILQESGFRVELAEEEFADGLWLCR